MDLWISLHLAGDVYWVSQRLGITTLEISAISGIFSGFGIMIRGQTQLANQNEDSGDVEQSHHGLPKYSLVKYTGTEQQDAINSNRPLERLRLSKVLTLVILTVILIRCLICRRRDRKTARWISVFPCTRLTNK
ncbi:uncharacterized protein LOC106160411 isoform X2 [Lingula anatina]|uniref:Uncharacterized protein LOC106160411 isoform X2 n=1 Tax=Lingula anatina TaxID=7574 RepID=A0A1S3I516_LINAN|nr:uncharacterized protein LOC106160411 isoform X2 [Lingula anatina]|eukprot:XP_013392459.1 uncharacterized protein LOC106160411 isoform X2 [Lingula anatina]